MINKNSKNEKRDFSWMSPKLEIKNVLNCGTGVFAKEKIKKGEILSILGGYIISFREESKLPFKYRDYGMLVHDNFVISSCTHREPSDSFNHSCDPNVGIKGQIFLVAMKKIDVGEQARLDYAMCLSYSKKFSPYFYKIKCLCGSKNCRGYITADDWKIPELQKKYKGYFQWYIQEKIDKLNNK